MYIDGQTKLLGLIGNNIIGSKSFLLHNTALQNKKINAVYLPFQLQEYKLTEFLHGLSLTRCIGFNITIPYKEDVLQFVDHVSKDVETIQAVNTLVRSDNGWVGHNTDHNGFWKSMEDESISFEDRSVFLWGAGGAAKAICYALHKHGVQQIFCWNRTVRHIKTLSPIIDVEYYDWKQKLPDHAVLINCTPLSKHTDYPQGITFNSSHIVIDLLYKKTPLLQLAETAGAKIVDGSGMLIHQAAKAFSLWFPETEATQIMKDTYQEYFQ